MGFLSRKNKGASSVGAGSSAPSARPVLALPVGRFAVDIVGESHYVKNIARAVGDRPGEHQSLATIVRDASNRHDENAVRVDLGGRPAGFIPSVKAPSYHGLLRAVDRAGQILQANCRVFYQKKPSEIGSVRLDMMAPEFAWPLNYVEPDPRAGFWPLGRALHVSVPEDTSWVIVDALARSYEPGACSIYVRMLPGLDTNRVELSLNGLKCGVLSAAASNRMMPIVYAASQRGKSLFAIATISGNALTSITKLLVTPADRLTDQQVNTLIL